MEAPVPVFRGDVNRAVVFYTQHLGFELKHPRIVQHDAVKDIEEAVAGQGTNDDSHTQLLELRVLRFLDWF